MNDGDRSPPGLNEAAQASLVQRVLVGLVDTSRRHAWLAVVAGILLALGSGFYATRHLGVNTDTDAMFSDQLPWRQRAIAMDRAFPQFQGLLVAVIDATAPEAAAETAQQLADALTPDQALFSMVSRPGSSPYLQKEGLLFLSVPDLTDLLNRTIDAQPFLGTLSADPTARGLFSALGLLGEGVTHAGADLTSYRDELRSFHVSMADALAGHARPLSWQQMLTGGVSDLGGKYQFVLFKPKLDFHSLQPGGAATAAIQAAVAKLPFVRSGEAHVRITGPVALADTQFASVASGTVTGLFGSVALITLWLILAVRSWRLIVPILATLVLGLLLTLLFATLAVGTLNLVSVGFGVLFVGIAVDFALQFAVRFREAKHDTGELAAAMRLTVLRAGRAILVAALATAAGFLAFVPTAFRGVAELGMIAGSGMLIAFLCTVTFLPAAITVFHPRDEQREIGFRWGRRADIFIIRKRRPILVAFGALTLLAVVLGPRLAFDSDPLDTQNQDTEAMRTLRDLMSQPFSNPYSIDVLTPNVDAARALAAQLHGAPMVDSVLSLDSFVPKDQPAKLALIADASDVLAATLAAPAEVAKATPDQIRAAANDALEKIEPALQRLQPDDPLAAIAGDLRAVERAPDERVQAVDVALTRFLPAELDKLRTALSAAPATLASVPPDIRRDWVLPDGRARVQALPVAAARNSAGLHRFVAAVTRIAPDAGGTAVTVISTSDTIVGAFKSAALAALAAIAVILGLALGRVLDASLVLAPLLLSAALTVLVMVLLPLPLNYANIIALPLLLGVGVSFNIYFVMNWRAGRPRMLGSATARAVAFSALTTGTAFGSLALSGHPGTASMGKLLLISLACTLLTTLVFVPALLSALSPPHVREARMVAARAR